MKCKTGMKSGTAQPCFCVDMAAAQEAEGFSDDQAAYISGTLLETGSDTTSSTLYGFIQAMVLFPEVPKKAQEELDRVVGRDRLPEMPDMDSLQYIRGCMKESLCWMPTTIIGAVPHAVTKDDEYMGYLIPKGAGVLNNVYTIHHDPKRFPDPRRFDPDRYKDDRQSLYEAASNPDASTRDTLTFGAGRRICAGMHVAERSLFLGISWILWSFDIRPAVDQTTRKVLMPDPEKPTQGFVCMPEQYHATITPRSPERAERIKYEWEQAQKSLDPKTKQWIEVPKGMALPSL
jgi:cytochrome P450